MKEMLRAINDEYTGCYWKSNISRGGGEILSFIFVRFEHMCTLGERASKEEQIENKAECNP